MGGRALTDAKSIRVEIFRAFPVICVDRHAGASGYKLRGRKNFVLFQVHESALPELSGHQFSFAFEHYGRKHGFHNNDNRVQFRFRLFGLLGISLTVVELHQQH
jgi:hypothetical protein